MKKIILFYGSFDPIHIGHIKIATEALKKIKADKLYFGLNKNSNLKNLTPFLTRKKMIQLAIKNKKKFDILDIKFDYKNLDSTYNDILSFCNDENEYYIPNVPEFVKKVDIEDGKVYITPLKGTFSDED